MATDANGRYSFCGLPPDQGRVFLICSNDNWIGVQPVLPRGDMTLDIDATEFRKCLWYGRPASSFPAMVN